MALPYEYLNLGIEFWGVLFSAVGIIASILIARSHNTYSGEYIQLFLYNGLAQACDAVLTLYSGSESPADHIILYGAKFGCLLMTTLILCTTVEYLCHRIYLAISIASPESLPEWDSVPIFIHLRPRSRQPQLPNREARRLLTWNEIVWIISLISVILLLISLCTGFVFFIDVQGIYHRGIGYPLFLALGALLNFGSLISITYYEKYFTDTGLVCALLYILLPMLCAGLYIFFPQLSIPYWGYTIVALILYLRIQGILMEQVLEQEKHLNDARADLMISQIQPHFLYNVLNSIYSLCDRDPQQAKEAISDFSDYLRSNMDSLTLKQPIPLAKELEHVEQYLRLEKIRFGDRLNIDIHSEARNCTVPPLTIQPLAENAVKHGICVREEGGTLTIRTWEDDQNYCISVSDDGIGFDPDAPRANDGRSHVGIDSVRRRIEAMSGGTLELKSTPGEGTTALICIPRKQRKE